LSLRTDSGDLAATGFVFDPAKMGVDRVEAERMAAGVIAERQPSLKSGLQKGAAARFTDANID
jgi:hypothetical protein